MARHAAGPEATTLQGELPAGELEALLAAFRAYEAALMTNDLDVLDDSFAPGDATLRGDAGGLLVGHARISAFRGLRGGVARRAITAVHVRVVSPDAALVVSVSEFAAGGSGLQTQLWQRVDGRWVIGAAHVTGAAPAINRSVWRVVGAPLVAASPAAEPGTGAEPGVAADAGAGAVLRPLAGMTVAVKDLFGVAGFAVGAGNPEYLAGASVATADADAVAALRAAGAAVQGIAQTDEFAYSIAGRNRHYGTPPNPAVPGALPGGSSSGPAAAVALGQASIGLATDTAGSIRVPASYQGLWGIRTSHGAVSTRGLLPLAPTFDTIGWLARSAATLRAAATVSFAGAPGETPVDVTARLEPRFVVAPELLEGCDADVVQAFDEFVGAGEAALGGIDRVELGGLDEVFAAFRAVQGAEAWRSDGEWVTAHPDALGADVAERFAIAAAVTGEQEAAGRKVLRKARKRFDAALGGRVLLLPSASSAAPPLNASAAELGAVRAATLRMTAVAGAGGYPAVSAPLLAVPTAGGLAPLGLCFVGPRGSDLALIELAASV
ncbi:AtzH-like domain-containing protein [Herbiconiux sp. P18]|uniref:AtzH-like domain-containing protein n=1 Tax=Herbiconiux liangxiaofengii TaxID=3342795 RepID=UPI0035B863F3